jgi:hypothetical protein
MRLMAPAAPEHTIVRNTVHRLLEAGHTLVLSPQVLTELWVIATRPVEVNGFGWSPAATSAVIARLAE